MACKIEIIKKSVCQIAKLLMLDQDLQVRDINQHQALGHPLIIQVQQTLINVVDQMLVVLDHLQDDMLEMALHLDHHTSHHTNIDQTLFNVRCFYKNFF